MSLVKLPSTSVDTSLMRGFTAVWLIVIVSCASILYMGYLDFSMRQKIYAELSKAEHAVVTKNLPPTEKTKSLKEIETLRTETKSTLFFNVSTRRKQVASAEALSLMIEYSQPGPAHRMPAGK